MKHSDSDSREMKSEIVFDIGGEGGGICIYREKIMQVEKFIYYHNEFDPDDDDNFISIKNEFSMFEQAFQKIYDKYSWHMLYILEVHDDFKVYISERLIEKLNEKLVSPDNSWFKKSNWEEVLRISLSCSKTGREGKFGWSFEKIAGD